MGLGDQGPVLNGPGGSCPEWAWGSRSCPEWAWGDQGHVLNMPGRSRSCLEWAWGIKVMSWMGLGGDLVLWDWICSSSDIFKGIEECFQIDEPIFENLNWKFA
jgi:hypothetical protein